MRGGRHEVKDKEEGGGCAVGAHVGFVYAKSHKRYSHTMPPAVKSKVIRGSNQSTRLRLLTTTRRSTNDRGPPVIQKATLGPKGLDEFRRAASQAQRERRESLSGFLHLLNFYNAKITDMTADQLQSFEHLRGLADDDDFDPDDINNTLNMVNMEGVLDGSERIDLSHAGGEFGTWEDELEDGTDDEGAERKTRYVGSLF